MAENSTKRLEWARSARLAFETSIARIASEDVRTASLVESRVLRSLALLQNQPKMGAPSVLVGRRVYPIPNTGHSVNYRITRDTILILRWYRQRQNFPR